MLATKQRFEALSAVCSQAICNLNGLGHGSGHSYAIDSPVWGTNALMERLFASSLSSGRTRLNPSHCDGRCALTARAVLALRQESRGMNRLWTLVRKMAPRLLARNPGRWPDPSGAEILCGLVPTVAEYAPRRRSAYVGRCCPIPASSGQTTRHRSQSWRLTGICYCCAATSHGSLAGSGITKRPDAMRPRDQAQGKTPRESNVA